MKLGITYLTLDLRNFVAIFVAAVQGCPGPVMEFFLLSTNFKTHLIYVTSLNRL